MVKLKGIPATFVKLEIQFGKKLYEQVEVML